MCVVICVCVVGVCLSVYGCVVCGLFVCVMVCCCVALLCSVFVCCEWVGLVVVWFGLIGSVVCLVVLLVCGCVW